jgi:hypothetical protein
LLIPIKKKYDKIVVGKKGRTKKPKII